MLMLMSEQMRIRQDTNSMCIEGKLELITMYNITEILQKLSIDCLLENPKYLYNLIALHLVIQNRSRV